LDAACTLALLQEEADGNRDMNKPVPKTALPLPPPPKLDKTVTTTEPNASSSLDSKLTAVKAYRRAMGLCYKCGVKWSKDHRCSPEVLHAIHDLWESLSVDDCSSTLGDSPQPKQLFLALPKTAVNGAPAARTIQFHGTLQGLPLSILIDSGSSSSFVSAKIAKQLSS
jgi:hypothetical protein